MSPEKILKAGSDFVGEAIDPLANDSKEQEEKKKGRGRDNLQDIKCERNDQEETMGKTLRKGFPNFYIYEVH